MSRNLPCVHVPGVIVLLYWGLPLHSTVSVIAWNRYPGRAAWMWIKGYLEETLNITFKPLQMYGNADRLQRKHVHDFPNNTVRKKQKDCSNCRQMYVWPVLSVYILHFPCKHSLCLRTPTNRLLLCILHFCQAGTSLARLILFGGESNSDLRHCSYICFIYKHRDRCKHRVGACIIVSPQQLFATRFSWYEQDN